MQASTNGKGLNSWKAGTDPCRSNWTGLTCGDGNVIHLDLSGDAFQNLSGTISQAVGNLTALTILRLNGTSLTGTIPPSLGNLTTLTCLDLSTPLMSHDNHRGRYGTQITGTIPESLGCLTALTHLYLQYVQLSGTIPPSLGNLIALTDLRLCKSYEKFKPVPKRA